jgi:hypothetical protein
VNGNRRALIVIIVRFLDSLIAFRLHPRKKMGRERGKARGFDGQKNSHVSAFPPFHPYSWMQSRKQ